MGNARIDDEQNAGFVSIANGPADEVGMRLTAKGGFDHVFDKRESRRMGGVLECMKNGCTVPVGEIEFAGRVGGEIVRDHTVDFRSKRLNSD